jgi:1-aminocyclopropane-1-carboxylate deaminase
MPLPENTSLIDLLQPFLHPEMVLLSRIHTLKGFGSRNVFVKRDDELSSGITGSKYRKYASLLPYLLQENFDEILLIGSAQSNNVVSLIQLLNEASLNTKLMLLESNEEDKKGNLLWLHLLHEMNDVKWIKREDWKNVNQLAENYAAEALQHHNKKVFIVTEGASVAQALPGAMSLANDILDYEKTHQLKFDHVFIDSGSGTAAIGLLYGFAMAGVSDKNIYITLIAGAEDEFQQQYKGLVNSAASIYNWPEKYFNGKVFFNRSLLAPSFGSITISVLDEVKNIARTEGILAEPVYTAKHFYSARKIIAGKNLQGNILVINSGGSLGLSGFQEKLNKVV